MQTRKPGLREAAERLPYRERGFTQGGARQSAFMLTRKSSYILTLMAALTQISPVQADVPTNLKPPVEDGIWIRPAAEGPAEPIIGFKDGIRIALWPTRGPRGVVRVHAQHVFPGKKYPTVNFIAIEPVVAGQRGLSELEFSKPDDRRGLRMWLSDKPDGPDALPWNPSRGRLGRIRVGGKSVQTLSVVLNVEKLDNGAHPSILITFRADRPNEVGFKVHAAKDSAPMESCVLTATMGNYSRTRLLWLKDEVIDSRKLWPDFEGDGFCEARDFPAGRFRREKDGTLTVAISPSESDLSAADMSPGGWTFAGKVATQYWRKYPGTAKPDLRVRVNGRAMYWRTQAEIPGGVSYENFELIEKFEPGTELWFGVTLETPREMGWPKGMGDG